MKTQIESMLRMHDALELLWGEVDEQNEVFARNALGGDASDGADGQVPGVSRDEPRGHCSDKGNTGRY